MLDQDEEKRLKLFRLSMGAVFPKPMMFGELDDMLLGRYPGEQEIRAYVELIARKIRELCGESVQTDYKYMVCKGLCERTLLQLIRGKTDGY